MGQRTRRSSRLTRATTPPTAPCRYRDPGPPRVQLPTTAMAKSAANHLRARREAGPVALFHRRVDPRDPKRGTSNDTLYSSMTWCRQSCIRVDWPSPDPGAAARVRAHWSPPQAADMWRDRISCSPGRLIMVTPLRRCTLTRRAKNMGAAGMRVALDATRLATVLSWAVCATGRARLGAHRGISGEGDSRWGRHRRRRAPAGRRKRLRRVPHRSCRRA
jgi:hypothetical protein